MDIAAVVVGYKNWHDDDPQCNASGYPWPLSEWLVIVGSMAIVRIVFHMLVSVVAVVLGAFANAADIFSSSNRVVVIIWILPEFALWIVGCVMLDNVSESCQLNHASVYDMSMAFVVFRAISMVIQICMVAGHSCGKLNLMNSNSRENATYEV